MDAGAGGHDDVSTWDIFKQFCDGATPPIDSWLVRMFDLVDIVDQDEVRVVCFDAAQNPGFIVSDHTPQLFVGLELIKRVSVEWKIEEPFRIVTSLDALMNELVEECRFPGAPSSHQTEKWLVLELASGLVGTCEMIEVALLSCGE
ncbi:hypothetical protein GCM10008992_32290 [Halorubrum aquaticum]